MNNWSLSRKTLVAMALGCGSLVFSAGPVAYALAQDSNAPAAAQNNRPDAQIETDVQKQLKAPGMAGQQITATTNAGVVTLTGSVTDEVTRQLAENAASGVAGVRSVQNQLSVGDVPAPQADASAAAAPVEQSAAPQQNSENNSSPNSGWGPAGPPPDAVNGQVPPQPPADDQNQSAQGNPQSAGAPPSASTVRPPSGTSYGAPPAGAYPAYPGYPAGQYPNGQAPIRPQYQQYQQAQQAPPPQYAQPKGPVTIPAGALVSVRLQNPVDGRRVQVGDSFIVNASRDVFQDGVLALPLGATLEGRVVAVKKPGAFAGGGFIQLQLTQLDLDGHSYPIASDVFSTVTPGKGGYSAANTIGGAAFGAIIGAAVGGGPGAAVGAVAGGGTGAIVSSATPAPRTFIPAETMITFHLTAPVTLQPVSYQEATRLAATMPMQRPVVLQPRRPYYGPGYYPGPY